MLGLKERTTRSAFVVWMPLLFALVAAQPPLYALLHRGLLRRSGCAVDTCGALGLVVSLYIKPILVVAIIALFVWPAVRRSRDAGMPASIGLLVPILLLIDVPLFLFAGAPWSLGFTLGRIGPAPMPVGTLAALVATILLAIPASRPPRDWRIVPKDWPERIASGAAVVTVVGIVAGFILTFAVIEWPMFSLRILAPVVVIKNIAYFVFLIATVVVLIRRIAGKPALAG